MCTSLPSDLVRERESMVLRFSHTRFRLKVISRSFSRSSSVVLFLSLSFSISLSIVFCLSNTLSLSRSLSISILIFSLLLSLSFSLDILSLAFSLTLVISRAHGQVRAGDEASAKGLPEGGAQNPKPSTRDPPKARDCALKRR